MEHALDVGEAFSAWSR